MSTLLKRDLPWIILVLCALTMYFDYFTTITVFDSIAPTLQTTAVLITNISVGIGVINFGMQHVRLVQRRAKGLWPMSAWLLIVMAISLIAVSLPPVQASEQWQWIVNRIFTASSQSIYAIIGFFFWSAAYRTIRISRRSTVSFIETVLFMFGALVLLLSNSPLGEFLLPGIGTWGAWLLRVPGAATFRGITMGVAIALCAWALRLLIGIERLGMAAEE
jgi:hypothetical protein